MSSDFRLEQNTVKRVLVCVTQITHIDNVGIKVVMLVEFRTIPTITSLCPLHYPISHSLEANRTLSYRLYSYNRSITGH